MGLVIQLLIPLALALAGLLIGALLERKHYRSIRAREEALRHILVFNEKRTPMAMTGQHFHLVQGSVVISSDYFKNIAAGLKSFFGGRLTSYESLMDRGRREAILRMKEQAAAVGATAIFAVRLETSTLHSIAGRGGIGCAEFLAYGTAWSTRP
ncbi:YbjQ family protein [Lampropedia aestuarii]|uniref:YbjQ family protein n=1 Tax=Lampropedia aestuarii TaxID=2562762 RepID=UPI0024693D39|nr:YbjQ family protein [Lampropedia aestuarii]MDH5857106.1 YbjQ family protein [Lampropedia aestuarii]